MAQKTGFLTAYSTIDLALCKILTESGFLKDAQKKIINKKKYIDVKIAYQGKSPVMTDFKIISRPGRRIYIGSKDIRPVRQNFGVGILSTPEGILESRQARKRKVGGEYLCQVW